MGDCGAFILGVMGTEFVGKTELCHIVQQQLTENYGLSAYIIDEIVKASPHKAQKQSTTRTQQWILEKQEEMILANKGLFDILICDRIFLDNCYGYWQYAAINENIEAGVIGKHLINWGLHKTKQYANLILNLRMFPATEKQMDDGYREGDPVWRAECYARISQGVKDFLEYAKAPKIFDLHSPIGKNGDDAAKDVQRQALEIIQSEIIPIFSNGEKYSPTFKKA